MDLKRLLIGTTAAVALTAGTSAQAENYYVSFFGGVSTLDADFSARDSGSYSNQILDWNFGKYRATGITKLHDFGTKSPPTWVNWPGGTPTGKHVINSRYTGKYFSMTTNQFTEGRWSGDFDTGFVIGAAVGYQFMDGWRGELEVAYRSHDLDNTARLKGSMGYGLNAAFGMNLEFGTKLATVDLAAAAQAKYTGTGPGPVAKYQQSVVIPIDTRVRISGDADTWSFMANVFYDFNTDSKFKPFVGGGIGFAQMSFNHSLRWTTTIATYQWPTVSTYLPLGTAVTKKGTKSGTKTGTNVTGSTKFSFGGTQARRFSLSYRVDDDDWAFAYQFGMGFGYDIGNGMLLTAQSRFFGTTDFDFGPQISTNVQSFNFMVGMRIPLQ